MCTSCFTVSYKWYTSKHDVLKIKYSYIYSKHHSSPYLTSPLSPYLTSPLPITSLLLYPIPLLPSSPYLTSPLRLTSLTLFTLPHFSSSPYLTYPLPLTSLLLFPLPHSPFQLLTPSSLVFRLSACQTPLNLAWN